MNQTFHIPWQCLPPCMNTVLLSTQQGPALIPSMSLAHCASHVLCVEDIHPTAPREILAVHENKQKMSKKRHSWTHSVSMRKIWFIGELIMGAESGRQSETVCKEQGGHKVVTTCTGWRSMLKFPPMLLGKDTFRGRSCWCAERLGLHDVSERQSLVSSPL